ncbi:MAG: endonuclease [Bacteroidales bacterium]|jgi:endonuclease I|nr:endonuclease [Bacteroidales bacterium]
MKNIFTFLLLLVSWIGVAQIPEGYYDRTEGLQGEQLKGTLYQIIKDHTDYPYTSSSTDTWDILKESDRDPDDPDHVILIYTGWSVDAAQEYNSGSGWNREHIWAKSHGFPSESQDAYRDAHHLRPSDISVNSARGTKDFDNGGEPHHEATECNTDSDSWEPRDPVKGDVARMMFYMATRYEGENGDPDLELVDYTGTDTDTPFFGKLSTLLQWNEEDPVDDFERNRNEVVYSYQGNRNPFVDHPGFAEAIYNPQEDTTTTAIPEIELNETIKLYPNPAQQLLTVEAPENYTVELYSMGGELILTSSPKQIDINHLASGVYFVVIKNPLGQTVKSEKIIKP